ncbi:hypothetical protein GQ43DRAFT_114656 [Delitschia confertaspora ATCC 74209]|uniref:Uncharacterized protein n=1 Tax=Delitschia confertaspora ATCC 74209 TaxID=1513339 RepID=A0A9P4JJW7_9PLEO|nr:hypothetical protein GQ43DRAFT_114656 [Delitschia confertaspora ATCC 74209]
MPFQRLFFQTRHNSSVSGILSTRFPSSFAAVSNIHTSPGSLDRRLTNRWYIALKWSLGYMDRTFFFDFLFFSWIWYWYAGLLNVDYTGHMVWLMRVGCSGSSYS